MRKISVRIVGTAAAAMLALGLMVVPASALTSALEADDRTDIGELIGVIDLEDLIAELGVENVVEDVADFDEVLVADVVDEVSDVVSDNDIDALTDVVSHVADVDADDVDLFTGDAILEVLNDNAALNEVLNDADIGLSEVIAIGDVSIGGEDEFVIITN